MSKRYRLGEWDGPSNYSSGYKFTSTPKPEDLTWKLLEYIELCEYAGLRATKKEFLLDFLGKKLRKDQLPGHLSSLFGSVQDAGIVNRIRSGRLHFYVKGINADHYRNGTLKCAKPAPRVIPRRGVSPSQRTIGPPHQFNGAIVRTGSSVIMVPREGTPYNDLVEDLEFAKRNGDGGDVTHFFKNLNDPVRFDEVDLIYAPWSFYDESKFSSHLFGFNVYDRWGDKWSMMYVREIDIIKT